MTEEIDYSAVKIPDDESPEDYHFTARRADILHEVLDAGSPAALNQSRLAERYGVGQSQISQDMDVLGDHVADALGEHAMLETRAGYEKIKRELFNEGEWKKAWDVMMDWNDWLGDLGIQERAPEKFEHKHEQSLRELERVRLERVETMREETGLMAAFQGQEEITEEDLAELPDEFTDGPDEIPVQITAEAPTDYPQGYGPDADDDSDDDAETDSGSDTENDSDTDTASTSEWQMSTERTTDADDAPGSNESNESYAESRYESGHAVRPTDFDGGEGLSGKERGRRRAKRDPESEVNTNDSTSTTEERAERHENRKDRRENRHS